MTTTVVKMDKQIIMHKMQELCSLLLQDEGYKEMREMIDQFAADEQATEQYERFMEKHQALEEKERQNIELLFSPKYPATKTPAVPSMRSALPQGLLLQKPQASSLNKAWL